MFCFYSYLKLTLNKFYIMILLQKLILSIKIDEKAMVGIGSELKFV